MSRSRSEAVATGIDHLVIWVRRNAPNQVSTSTIGVLDTLLTDGPLRISQLAEREAISQPGITTLVDRLEVSGQAVRVPDPLDGRATLVRITDLGVKALTARQADRVAALVAGIERLGARDRAALVAALPAIERLIQRPNRQAS